MNKKNITIIGAFGCGNAGDDAILNGLISTYGDISNITVTSGMQVDLTKELDIKTIRCRFCEGISISVLLCMIIDVPRIMLNIAKCDILFIGGGSLIHDLRKYNLPFFFLLQSAARFFHKPIFYVNIGVGPIDTPYWRKNIHKHLNKAVGVYPRDEYGVRLLKDLGVRNAVLAADAVFSTQPYSKINHDSQVNGIMNSLMIKTGEYITFTSCRWFTGTNFWKQSKMNFSNEVNFLKEVISFTYERYSLPIVFVPTVFHDYWLGCELKKMIDEDFFMVVEKNLSPKIYSAIIGNSFMLVGMRMHSLLFAAKAYVPFITIVYDQKVRNFLKMFEMSEYSMELDEIDIDKYKRIIDTLYNNYDCISEKLKAKTEILMTRNSIISGEIKGAIIGNELFD